MSPKTCTVQNPQDGQCQTIDSPHHRPGRLIGLGSILRLQNRPGKPTGLSLLESLLVLAMTAIVLSWAVPQYQSHLRRGQRQAAKLGLMQTAQWLERAAAIQGSYPTPQQIPAALLQVPGNVYLIQVQTDASAHTFALQAAPQASQTQDACGVLTLNHLGEQGVQGASLSATECWSR